MIVEADMYTKVVVKAFKAKCLKHLTTARLAIELETDDLIRQLHRGGLNRPAGSSDCTSVLRRNDEVTIGCSVMQTPPPSHSPDEGGGSATPAAGNGSRTPHPSYNKIVAPGSSTLRSPPKKMRRQHRERSALSDISNMASAFTSARRAIEVIDIEKEAGGKQAGDFVISKKQVIPGVFAKPWWKLNDGPPRRDIVQAQKFYNWAIDCGSRAESIWVHHSVPKPVMRLGTELVDQLRPGGRPDSVTCDVIIRSLFTFETNNCKKVWRHFLESDFAGMVLGGGDYLHSRSIWEQFAGQHITHDLSHCQMILCMAFISNNWTGLCWDVKRKQITAFAPGHPVERGSISGDWSVHSKAMDVLHEAMQRCISSFFDGWNAPWTNWTKVLLPCCPSDNIHPAQQWAESVVLAIQFLRTFDGITHGAEFGEVYGSNNVRAELLYDAVNIIGNKVTITSS